MKNKQVILVNNEDTERGTMEKMEAHLRGELHRAYSVFIFNSKNELLLQRRAINKYHSGGLWTNTCCSHPQPGENMNESARKRLIEEMGIDCALKNVFNFIYKIKLDNELIEHELDHVFIGLSDESPKINLQEVMEWKFVEIIEIKKSLELNPESYTVWFKIIFERVLEHI